MTFQSIPFTSIHVTFTFARSSVTLDIPGVFGWCWPSFRGPASSLARVGSAALRLIYSMNSLFVNVLLDHTWSIEYSITFISHFAVCFEYIRSAKMVVPFWSLGSSNTSVPFGIDAHASRNWSLKRSNARLIFSLDWGDVGSICGKKLSCFVNFVVESVPHLSVHGDWLYPRL